MQKDSDNPAVRIEAHYSDMDVTSHLITFACMQIGCALSVPGAVIQYLCHSGRFCYSFMPTSLQCIYVDLTDFTTVDVNVRRFIQCLSEL